MRPEALNLREEDVFTSYRRRWLRLLSGAQGKTPGDPPIVSMGSQAPPYVDKPVRPIDWLKSDGAQVTRPSIDPYRELVETSVFLTGGRTRLSMPIGLEVDDWGLEDKSLLSVVATAYRIGVALYTRSEDVVNVVRGCGISSPFIIAPLGLIDKDVGEKTIVATMGLGQRAHGLRLTPTCLEIPSDKSLVESLAREPGLISRFSGLLINEDHEDSRDYVEVTISLADTMLRKIRSNSGSLREKLDLLAKSSTLRGSDDIFKLITLGSDLVIVNKLARIGIGLDEQTRKPTREVLSDRLEYLLLGLQREIKLLAGAAGVSSLHNTLRSNRELLRCLDLPGAISSELRVKHAGVVRI